MMSELGRLVGTIAPRTGFPTVEQMLAFTRDLAERFPSVASTRVIGMSRAGDPIHAVTVGDGSRHAIVVGNPHPNEPVGLVTIQHLLTRLCQDDALRAELDITWHFVPCVDPDGTRRNEGWYGGPITRSHYARHFYRPSADEQAEWSFPVQWAGKTFGNPIPETQALMQLIDATRPEFLASLHNAEINRGFFYVTGGDTEYWAGLTGLLADAGIAVERGLSDTPGARTFAPGVYEASPFGVTHDVIAQADPQAAAALSGGSTRDYSAQYGTSILICEVPLWAIPEADDDSPGSRSMRDLLHAAAAANRENADLFTGILKRLDGRLPDANPFYRAIVKSLPRWAAFFDGKAAVADSADDRTATRSEEFTELYGVPEMLKLRIGGMLLQLFDEVDPSGVDADIQRERRDFAEVFDGWCADVDAHRPGESIPIATLAAVQAGAIVLAATRIRDGLPA
ncbi:M14 family zinc carboxypeptidase [Dactylosporangium sp. CA-233914]|uniref:M14 family zinc carboxypeptidase n=1 Tax=Dactylosporangium sp. CA-233914 TaxID=3239934 RepID=UPI003D9143AC